MFTPSPHLCIEVRDRAKARRFYQEIFGLKESEKASDCGEEPMKALLFGNQHLWLADPKEEQAPRTYFEFEVEKIGPARELLLENGCQITREFKPTSLMFVDPFGFRFHVYEKGTLG